VAVSGITTATAIAAGIGHHTCALLSGGSVECWGYNGDGELGNGTTTDSSTPVAVSGITTATAIAAGGFHTCALLSGGSVKCWGDNSYGELGNGTGTNSSVPVAVVWATPLAGATYVSLTPSRLLDTRNGTGLSGTFSSGVARTFAVSGHGGVPAGAIAVTGNLTVTNQTSAGFVALTPDPTNSPTTSTLNFPLGDNRANGVTVALSGTGTLSATYMGSVGGATTDLLFDVTGYFVP